MATYVISDLHGDYEGYRRILTKIGFGEDDVLYVNGDVIDRGEDSIKILQHMMMQPNIFPVLGNHEYIGCQALRFLMNEITEESVESLESGLIEGLLQWQEIGGRKTMDEFSKLRRQEQEDVLEYLEEFSLYEEVAVKGKIFVIVHAGLDNFSQDRKLDDYRLHEFIFKSPDYGRVYYKDKYLVTGHLPTMAIEGNARPNRIYMANNHIAVDCGAGYDGRVGAICLETFEEFYSDD